MSTRSVKHAPNGSSQGKQGTSCLLDGFNADLAKVINHMRLLPLHVEAKQHLLPV